MCRVRSPKDYQWQNEPVKEFSMMKCESRVFLLAGFIAILGCEQPSSVPASGKVTSEDVRHDVGKAVDTTAEFSQQTKDEFQQKLEARLKELDAELVVLREKGRDLKDEAKVKWDQKLAELETKRDTARAKLAAVNESSVEAWKDLQKGAQAAWNDMDKAFSEASREF
jgi:TolA-binding protein